MSNIFISYRREDSIDIVGRIYDWLALRVPRESIFIDIDNIPAAVDFRLALQEAVGKASIVLVVIGQRWLDAADAQGRRRLDNPDDFVRTEIEAAMQRNVPILPILVQNAAMPSAGALPPTLAPLSYRNALPVRSGPDFPRDMERVAKAIEIYVPGFANSPGPAATSPRPQSTTTPPLAQGPTVTSSLVAMDVTDDPSFKNSRPFKGRVIEAHAKTFTLGKHRIDIQGDGHRQHIFYDGREVASGRKLSSFGTKLYAFNVIEDGAVAAYEIELRITGYSYNSPVSAKLWRNGTVIPTAK